jgi:hypothetical protein
MSRCNCIPFCPRCSEGPCDCTCSEQEVKEYFVEREARITKQKASDIALRKKAKALGLTDDEIYQLGRL